MGDYNWSAMLSGMVNAFDYGGPGWEGDHEEMPFDGQTTGNADFDKLKADTGLSAAFYADGGQAWIQIQDEEGFNDVVWNGTMEELYGAPAGKPWGPNAQVEQACKAAIEALQKAASV